jgi:hypothetical protein
VEVLTIGPKNSRRTAWLLRAAKLLIIVLVVWAVHRTLLDAWDQWRKHPCRVEVGWLLVAALCYFLGTLPAGYFWHLVLRALGQDSRLWPTLRAYTIGGLGKYVPGKAVVVVVRAGLVRGPGVSSVVAGAAVFVETLTMMAVGSVLGATIMILWLRGRGFSWYIPPVAAAAAALAVSPTLPPVFRYLMRLLRIGMTGPDTAQHVQALGYKTILWGWLLMPLMWFCWGISYWASLRAVGVEGGGLVADFLACTAAVSLATVIGFATLVMPGGAVVREAALVQCTVPYLTGLTPSPQLVAWAGAIMLRLVWLVSEAAVSVILYFLPPRGNTHDMQSSSNDFSGPSDPSCPLP